MSQTFHVQPLLLQDALQWNQKCFASPGVSSSSVLARTVVTEAFSNIRMNKLVRNKLQLKQRTERINSWATIFSVNNIKIYSENKNQSMSQQNSSPSYSNKFVRLLAHAEWLLSLLRNTYIQTGWVINRCMKYFKPHVRSKCLQFSRYMLVRIMMYERQAQQQTSHHSSWTPWMEQ